MRVENISKTESNQQVLYPISFQLGTQRKLAIVGETGSGKSTLLRIIGGHIAPDSGKVYFNQERVWSPPVTLLPGHKGIAYLSQHYELRNNYKVHELLSYQNVLSPQSAAQLYKVCQVDHLLNRKNDELSGGERQRIALAKLLVGVPQLLLLDEPFSNLDIPHKQIINAVVHTISEQLNITCILVSHDPVDTLSWADEIIVLKNGQVIQYNTAQEIYYRPANAYVAGLFGAYNLLEGSRHTFRKYWLLPDGNSPICIRPEQLIITHDHTDAMDCVVEKVLFCGPYWSVTAKHGEYSLVIHTTENIPEPGTLIWVRLKNPGSF
ncbi:MAG: ABC transporter ATP-binding protein [Chitinophagaceae bacterium]|nr:ABC transporter ATP-binding protein [Chitinophagaceae bacterium]